MVGEGPALDLAAAMATADALGVVFACGAIVIWLRRGK